MTIVEAGSQVFIYGDTGPFRVVACDDEHELVWLCTEEEWEQDRGAALFPLTEGCTYFELYPDTYTFEDVQLEKGPDNSVGYHSMIDEVRTRCGLTLARCLHGYVRYGAASEDEFVTCEACRKAVAS